MAFNELHISSLIIHVIPLHIEHIKQQINTIDGVEVIGSNPNGKIVVVIECEKEHQITSTLEQITKFEYVLAGTLVFHQIEDTSIS